ncbi:hypothetical protein J4G43_025590 [Bradyrhizobium barranii subsp. barranii]|uniref:Uncharacterized protein n=1 Tax=Bradyrhizobium barranii subsp. barranii TaxID=2823807 RepID=A0A939M848_9BRAD|nr:hypothetical protein [Bradyrhizobium barranii]UEM17306.1 hypothetical protein J4G43_025590 [Bradyrhizobium barranii subsp. barranii]
MTDFPNAPVGVVLRGMDHGDRSFGARPRRPLGLRPQRLQERHRQACGAGLHHLDWLARGEIRGLHLVGGE